MLCSSIELSRRKRWSPSLRWTQTPRWPFWRAQDTVHYSATMKMNNLDKSHNPNAEWKKPEPKRTFCTISLIWHWKKQLPSVPDGSYVSGLCLHQSCRHHTGCFSRFLRNANLALFQKFGTIRADLIEQMRFKQRLKVIQTLEDTTKRNVVSPWRTSLWPLPAPSSHSCQLRNPRWHPGDGLESQELAQHDLLEFVKLVLALF